MHRSRMLRIGILIVTVASSARLGDAVTLAQHADKPSAGDTSAAPATTGTVVGVAWKGDVTPFPDARIRLRDVENGRGAGLATSDREGRFRFNRVSPGAYVVELLANDDKVLAVGDLFSVTAGNQSVTLVRLSSKAPWSGGFWGNAAAAVIAAASTLGVTASGSSGRPISPQ